MHSSKPVEYHHARITEDVRQNILRGEWEPGRQLPKETDLAESYGVSRMTMNKVLTQLSKEGFLVRRKRSGTFVAQPRGQSAVMEINDIAQEVAALRLNHEWKLFGVQLRLLNEGERRLLDMSDDAKGRRVLFLNGLHLAKGEPFCLETRTIDAAVVPAALKEDFRVTVPGQWLLKSMPFSTANHRIRAVNAVGRDARLLELPVGAACLEVLRKTRLEQNWVTHVRLLYPGEAHQLVADFAPTPPP
ncbi:MAG TPA: UTRA domain-containing protein [Terriglobia bacterium]|nr:UTRA domain-containing protein [Terriglobia bacterium]